ncbi:MAG: ABC transporter ATP-binding protein [Candidatus Peribacteria bacterium]|nr:MAG: ABC transporter ATP-binding protein [Candidatus Peribacteria bacterium]
MDTLILFVGSLISLGLIWYPAALGVLTVGVVALLIVGRFDVYLIRLIKKKNRKEHLIMSTVFDFLSNIRTVITLRFESRALALIQKKIADVLPTYMRYVRMNELKRFTMDNLLALSVAGVIGRYMYVQFASK